MLPPPANPFEFGRELGLGELVDREEELDAVLATMRSKGRLFLIGPRRFGKTTILRAATEAARGEGVVVLRYNAEAFPTIGRLGQAIVEDAAAALTGPVQKVAQLIEEFFASLKPQVSYNPRSETFAISLAPVTRAAPPHALLADVLDGLDRLAASSAKPVVLVIDEFQQVVEQGGVAAEAQLRAAVQRHDHLAYVFAGSKTALLTEMTGNPDRPFYRLGARLFIGAIPREDFAPWIAEGFTIAGFDITDEAVTEILDLAADVPYNVQRLAYECWNHARDRGAESGPPIDVDEVRAVLERLVRRDDPFYTQTWNRLAASQQKALVALVENHGRSLYAREVLGRHGLPLSTMRTALEALTRSGIARHDERQGAVHYLLEDPFFGVWVRLFVAAP
jgi:uncharacterized protein